MSSRMSARFRDRLAESRPGKGRGGSEEANDGEKDARPGPRARDIKGEYDRISNEPLKRNAAVARKRFNVGFMSLLDARDK